MSSEKNEIKASYRFLRGFFMVFTFFCLSRSMAFLAYYLNSGIGTGTVELEGEVFTVSVEWEEEEVVEGIFFATSISAASLFLFLRMDTDNPIPKSLADLVVEGDKDDTIDTMVEDEDGENVTGSVEWEEKEEIGDVTVVVEGMDVEFGWL